MGEQSAWSGHYNVGAGAQAAALLLVALAVVTAIDGEAADRRIVGKPLKCLINLAGELASRRHDETVDSFGRMGLRFEQCEERKQVGGCFPCAGLGYAYHIAAGEDMGYALFLYGGALLEVHVVERIEHIVGKGKVFEIHGVCLWFCRG